MSFGCQDALQYRLVTSTMWKPVEGFVVVTAIAIVTKDMPNIS